MKQIFNLTKKIKIECKTYETRYSWGHYAYLYIDGKYIGEKKITYYNRAWEAYTFQSILKAIVNKFSKSFTKRQLTLCKKFIDNPKQAEKDPSMQGLKTIAMIAKMGDIFGNTQKEKNDWKARMLKAGLENKGLIMPENWESLTEAEKEKRLNGAIKQLA